MAKHTTRASSKYSKRRPETDVCVFCESPFEVKTSYKYLTPHVCPKCRSLSSVKWAAQYRQRSGSSIKDAWTKLFLAIKKQAEEDGKLDEWKKRWVDDVVMQQIWQMFSQELHRQSILNSSPLANASQT